MVTIGPMHIFLLHTHNSCVYKLMPNFTVKRCRLKDGREVAIGHRIQSDSSKGKENELNLSLFISDADMTDTGEYKVIAKNSEGQATIAARLTVNSIRHLFRFLFIAALGFISTGR